MKKLNLIILGLGCFIIQNTNAQFLEFGPRVGISSSNVSIDDAFNYNGDTYKYTSSSARFGFHVGAYARISLFHYYVQPELLFTSSGGTIDITNTSGTINDIRKIDYNKIDVPVIFGRKFLKFFRIQVGPSFSLLLSDNIHNSTSTVSDVKENYQKATVGYQAGVGIDLGKTVIIDLKYEGNLGKFANSVNIGNQTFNTDLRSSQWILSMGFNLL